MELKSLGQILKAALIAGLIAGAVASSFHWAFTEPIIERAIEIENRGHAGSPEQPVVSRPMQKVGLFAGFVIYGVVLGNFLSLLGYAVRPWYAEMGYGRQMFLLALLLGWVAGVFPFLKYPANPPGVGEAETIGYRQELFVALIVLSLIGTTVAIAIERRLSNGGKSKRAAVIEGYVIYLAVIYFALPENSGPVNLPSELVQAFRALSLLGQLLFWGIMGGSFRWLWGKDTKLVSPLS